jgi:hypothetical protein
VVHLRDQAHEASAQRTWHAVRRVQVQRFRATYADFLIDRRHAPAARFFLAELYGQVDYSERDAQFARIAGAIERLFPTHVMVLAVHMAEVHALTETLDWAMAEAWAASPYALAHTATPLQHLAPGYLHAWRNVGCRSDREHQLQAVRALGEQLTRVVRIPGLRTALRLMRHPAHAAGLSALQAVLEQGFDAFAAMGSTASFLEAVRSRETHWLDTLDAGTPTALATTRLEAALLAQVPK